MPTRSLWFDESGRCLGSLSFRGGALDRSVPDEGEGGETMKRYVGEWKERGLPLSRARTKWDGDARRVLFTRQPIGVTDPRFEGAFRAWVKVHDHAFVEVSERAAPLWEEMRRLNLAPLDRLALLLAMCRIPAPDIAAWRSMLEDARLAGWKAAPALAAHNPFTAS